jgi:DNA-binding response OmpR family regulator
MEDLDLLRGKCILAVDDEPDVLDVIKESLPECEVQTARDFATAKDLMAEHRYDLVLLDIMGVNGFELLKEARLHNLPAAMLTAHAISADSVNKALKLGAVSFLPKEELVRLPELVAEILGELAAGRSHWRKLFKRLGPYFKHRLDLSWEELEKPKYPPYAY